MWLDYEYKIKSLKQRSVIERKNEKLYRDN